MAISSHKKLLLIGWDGADWKVINRLIDAGKMPQLSKFVEQGVMGNLATLYPEFSPILWTSIATGKRPFKHGILGFSEPDPNSGGVRPVSNLSRTTKAIWNILSQTGRKSNVVGWWPSHPAEPINGVMVSNHYHRAVAGLDKPWPISPGTVYPPRLAKDLEGLRVHPEEITQAHLQPFVPELAKIDQDKDKHLVSIAKIIAECSSVHSAATAIMQLEPWDFMAIYYDAIDHFSHGFMNFHPPQMKGVSNELFEMYKGVVEGGYCFHDMMLGTLLDLAGEDTTVIIMSDHGFHPDHLRRRNIPHEPAGAASQHRQFGILAMKGPGIKKDERLYGACLLDICPTILTCFGLPVGEDMDGRTLLNAFETPPDISSIPSWDDVPGKDGSHPPEVSIDPQEAHEAINQLVALGYIEKPNKNKEKAVAETLREQQYNLARSYIDANLHAAAVPIYEELVEKWPDEYRFGINLVMSYQALEQVSAARSLLENLFALKEKNTAKALGKLKIFNRKHKNIKPRDLSNEDKKELQQMQREAGRRPDTMDYLMGSLLFAEGDEDGALRHFRKVEKMNVRWPSLYIKLGNVYLKMKEWKKAEISFQKVLDIDPDNSEAHLGLCRCFLPRRMNKHAAEEALQSIGLLYFSPFAHFSLGIALHRLGNIPRAVEALNVAISQSPNYVDAHLRLALIFEKRLHEPEKAAEHRRLADQARKHKKEFRKTKLEKIASPGKKKHFKTSVLPGSSNIIPASDVPADKPFDPAETIIIVSGLPRSGTSMMMQMLKAGGIEPLADNNRKADDDNPRGYFEFTKAKKLRTDRSWLEEAKGRCVKIVAQLLPYLPPTHEHEYRIIMMERDMSEILSSQHSLLTHQGKKGADLSDEKLGEMYNQQLQRIKSVLETRPNTNILYINHGECIKNPQKSAHKVNVFLGNKLKESAMADVVDSSLYLHRQDKAKKAQ